MDSVWTRGERNPGANVTLRFPACRLPIPEPEKQCFVTFPSQPLTIPYTGGYTLYYAPSSNMQGIYIPTRTMHKKLKLHKNCTFKIINIVNICMRNLHCLTYPYGYSHPSELIWNQYKQAHGWVIMLNARIISLHSDMSCGIHTLCNWG